MPHPQLSDPRNYLGRGGLAAEQQQPAPDLPQGAAANPLEGWDPDGDLSPPETYFARLYVPQSERVPPMPPVPQQRPQAEAVQEATYNADSSTDLNAQLGFPCHSVIVDNLTNQWLFFRSPRRWVPPYSVGAIVAFLQSTQIASYVRAAPPGGFTLAAPVAGEQVQTTWQAAYNAPSSGTVVTKA